MRQRLTVQSKAFKPTAFKSVLFAALLAGTSLAGCSSTYEDRGYVYDQEDFEKIQPGLTSETEVTGILGTPSTIATIDGLAWYYISSKFEKLMFYEPEEIERKVVVVYFDDAKTVEDIGYYGLEDGQIIDFRTRKTPTRGKELTVLGQIFGNLGRFNRNQPAQPGR